MEHGNDKNNIDNQVQVHLSRPQPSGNTAGSGYSRGQLESIGHYIDQIAEIATPSMLPGELRRILAIALFGVLGYMLYERRL